MLQFEFYSASSSSLRIIQGWKHTFGGAAGGGIDIRVGSLGCFCFGDYLRYVMSFKGAFGNCAKYCKMWVLEKDISWFLLQSNFMKFLNFFFR